MSMTRDELLIYNVLAWLAHTLHEDPNLDIEAFAGAATDPSVLRDFTAQMTAQADSGQKPIEIRTSDVKQTLVFTVIDGGNDDPKRKPPGANLNPQDIVIVGFDTDDGPEHALYTARTKEAVDFNLVDQIRKNGYRDDPGGRVVVLEQDGRHFCMHGQFRVRAARVLELSTIPVTVRL